MPQIIEHLWPSFLHLNEYLNLGIYNCMVIVVIYLQFQTLITANLGFFFCYKLNIPFFEKYKSVEEPWPWQSDPEEWNHLFWRAIYLSIINTTIMNYLLSAPFIAASIPVPFRADNNFASPLTLCL